MIEIKQSTASIALVFRMVESADHITPRTGASPTVAISKNGGAFAAPAGAVSEIANGFYQVAPNSGDTDTLGILALHATATDADPAAMAYAVVENIESDTVAALDAADQILLASPYVPDESPALVIPAPDSDESLTVVFCHTENITNIARAGIELVFKLVTVPAKSERLLEIAPATAITDVSGYAAITLQSGLLYRVSSRELGLVKTFTPTGATFDLLSLVP